MRILYGILYRSNGRTFIAEVLARNEQEAVNVLWQKIVGGSPLVGRGNSPIEVESVERIARAEDVPYPEALPDGPALLAVVELQA